MCTTANQLQPTFSILTSIYSNIIYLQQYTCWPLIIIIMHICSNREMSVTSCTVLEAYIVQTIVFTALTSPMVAIAKTGLTTAGDVLILTCRVIVYMEWPDVEWVDSRGIMVTSSVNNGNVMRSGREFTLDLEFSPLHTSHGGQYTCIATINIQSLTYVPSHWYSPATLCVPCRHVTLRDAPSLRWRGCYTAALSAPLLSICIWASKFVSRGAPHLHKLLLSRVHVVSTGVVVLGSTFFYRWTNTEIHKYTTVVIVIKGKAQGQDCLCLYIL